MKAEDLKEKYKGEKAEKYEEERKKSDKWHKEQKAVRGFLKKITQREDRPSILDIPVGTGRFFPIYNELPVGHVMGVDASEDMLKHAEKKLGKTSTNDVELRVGDVMDPATYDVEPDVIVCVRLLNWLDDGDMKKALNNLLNSGAENIIVGMFLLTSDFLSSLPRPVQKLGEKVYRAWKGKKLRNTGTVHDKNMFLNEVDRNGFGVKDKKLVKEDSFSKMTYIYWLERK